MNKDLQIGQRVRLSASHCWERNDANPTHCDGTVIDPASIGGTTGWVYVDWDNGGFNSYVPEDDDLIPVEATA